jgi:tryptophan synthase alpha chain
MSAIESMFTDLKAEGRAALVGYLPAGYPSVEGSKELFAALVAGGCDLVEVGLPFSDPVLDGPVIQHAAQTALAGGFRIRDLFGIVETITAAGGRSVVMTYFNPVLAYGLDNFAGELAAAGGSGVITPDLIVDEAGPWLAAAHTAHLDPIFLVAPSSSAERIALTAASTSGFLYVASTMGVTGAREKVSAAAPELVARCRAITDLPLGVGLGVRTGEQAAQIAGFADAVIVGSAFVSAAERGGPDAVRELAAELAAGIRRADRPSTPQQFTTQQSTAQQSTARQASPA